MKFMASDICYLLQCQYKFCTEHSHFICVKDIGFISYIEIIQHLDMDMHGYWMASRKLQRYLFGLVNKYSYLTFLILFLFLPIIKKGGGEGEEGNDSLTYATYLTLFTGRYVPFLGHRCVYTVRV